MLIPQDEVQIEQELYKSDADTELEAILGRIGPPNTIDVGKIMAEAIKGNVEADTRVFIAEAALLMALHIITEVCIREIYTGEGNHEQIPSMLSAADNISQVVQITSQGTSHVMEILNIIHKLSLDLTNKPKAFPKPLFACGLDVDLSEDYRIDCAYKMVLLLHDMGSIDDEALENVKKGFLKAVEASKQRSE
jgi:hypothetical protein